MRTTLSILMLTVAASCGARLFADELPDGIAAEPPAEGPVIEIEGGYMVPYTATIPGTAVEFEMVPIPGGTFKIGSPEDEEDRQDDEGPQVEIKVAPFWMGKHEVTWSEYKLYMKLAIAFEKFGDQGIRPITEDNEYDAITAPSKLYDPGFTFATGEGPRQPAVSMSQFGAKQYTKWLSILREESYRLPTEVEWEYACRAGTTTAFWFGDDPDELEKYGWFYDNADDVTHDVGEMPANPFGLHDMHGNAAEWTLDAHTEDGYADWKGESQSSESAVHWPTQVFPRVVRGGGWYHDPPDCRSARRIASDFEWLGYDPNTPKSPWWLACDETQAVGMRLVRVPSKFTSEQRNRYWEADVDSILAHANRRIDEEGKGERGVVDKDLPAAVEKLGDIEIPTE